MEKKNFAWPVTSLEKADYTAVMNCVEQHKTLFETRRLVLYGAGIRGTLLSVILGKEGYRNMVFTDNNAEKWGGRIDEYDILSPEEALKNPDDILIVITPEEGGQLREQLLSSGWEENRQFFWPQSRAYDSFVEEFVRVNRRPHALIMGDCMFEMISFHDSPSENSSLAEMLRRKLGEEAVKLLSMHGMGLRAFYHVLAEQTAMGMKPEVFVVMINFETLTGKQHLLPRSQHSELMRRLCEVCSDPRGQMKEYADLTAERVKRVQTDFFTTNKFTTNNVGRISGNAAKVFFKAHYTYRLDTGVEGIQYLRKILEFCRERQIRAAPFVPPVNYQLGEELLGEEFETAYRSNLEAVKGVTESFGVPLLDLSHICGKELFAEESTPDETTNYRGRRKIMEYLVREINS